MIRMAILEQFGRARAEKEGLREQREREAGAGVKRIEPQRETDSGICLLGIIKVRKVSGKSNPGGSDCRRG